MEDVSGLAQAERALRTTFGFDAFRAGQADILAAILAGGVAWKCWVYARTPQPLKIPIPPAPATRRGVVLRMLVEVTLFRPLGEVGDSRPLVNP